jgi:O-antigen ligase
LHNGIERVVFTLYLVLLFSLGFMKPTLESPFAALTPTDLIFPLVFACWLGSIFIGVFPFKWNNAYWAFLLYLSALLISAIFSKTAYLSLGKLAGVLYLVLLAIMTISLATTVRRLRLSFFAFLAGAVVPLLAALAGIVLFYAEPESGVLQHITYHYGSVPMGNFPRISSTFVSASMFCNYLTVAFMITVISLRMGWIRRSLAIAAIVSITIAACFTVSIALGGMFLAIALWIWCSDSTSVMPRFASIGAFALAAAFLAIAPFALWTPGGTGAISPSPRLMVWKDAFATFVGDPLTGKGLGTGAAVVTYQNSDGTLSLLTDAHNVFLNVAAESGIFGLAALSILIVAIIRSAFVGSNDGTIKSVRFGLGIAFLAAFVYDGLTGSFEDARHLWVLIGFIFAAQEISKGED